MWRKIKCFLGFHKFRKVESMPLKKCARCGIMYQSED